MPRKKKPDEGRWCNYVQAFFCGRCFGGRSGAGHRAVVPQRAIFAWDMERLPVCTASKQYLDRIVGQPRLHLRALHPALFKQVKAVRHIRLLRVQLGYMRDCIGTCPKLLKLSPVARLMRPERIHLLQDTDSYSLRDLEAIQSGEMARRMTVLVETVGTHIVSRCADCQARSGATCGHCLDPRPIFPFQVLQATTCGDCGSVSHRQVSE